MKKRLLLLIAALTVFVTAKAGDGNRFFNLHIGGFYQKAFVTTIELEFEGKYGHSWIAYADLCNSYKYCDIDKTIFCKETFWDYQTAGIGAAYKHQIARFKNANLKVRGGVDLGTDYCKTDGYSFYLSVDVGIEYCYTFKCGIQLSITQKNDFCFFTRDNFKNGLMIGVKIPLN